jgi:regulator of sigma E protease
MSGILYFLAALLVFGLIIFAHELGHYLAARASGIRVLEFAMGFGPKLIGWRRKDIDYSIRIFPLGGYCKFEGEDESSHDPKAFTNAPVWKRFLTIFAGPAMNFVLAYLAVAVFLIFIGFLFYVPVVGAITPGMSAAASGLQAGDVITAVDGQSVERSEEGAAQLVQLISAGRPEDPVTLSVDRNGQPMEFSIAPQKTEDGSYKIGIELGSEIKRYAPFEALSISGYRIYDITVQMLEGFKGLITKGEGFNDAMGPVGIISFMTEEISRDFEMVINLIVIISLNVGIINLLPLPALDGGRLVFLVVEAVRRKPIKPEYEGWVHAAGFFLLIGLILVFTYRDIVRLVTGG